MQLHRRGLGTIVLRGMAAEFCCESTARDADEGNYELVFTSDAMTGAIAGGHAIP